MHACLCVCISIWICEWRSQGNLGSKAYLFIYISYFHQNEWYNTCIALLLTGSSENLISSINPLANQLKSVSFFSFTPIHIFPFSCFYGQIYQEMLPTCFVYFLSPIKKLPLCRWRDFFCLLVVVSILFLFWESFWNNPSTPMRVKERCHW